MSLKFEVNEFRDEFFGYIMFFAQRDELFLVISIEGVVIVGCLVDIVKYLLIDYWN